MSGPFKMKGSSFYGHGNSSPAKITDEEKQANLLKAVPNKEAYDKLSDEDKKGFDAAGKKVGLPTKEVESPAKQKEEKKDFSDKSKYETVRKGRTGGIAKDTKSGKYYSTSFGHEMVSDTTSNPFDPSIKTVKWYKKGDDK